MPQFAGQYPARRNDPQWQKAGIFLIAALLAGCAHAPLNQQLTQSSPGPTVDYVPRPPGNPSDGVAIFLFFSGGGTRSAALSYGVLKELSQTLVPGSNPPRRMLDDVEAISAVSGGSFTAAYYCLYHDRIFTDFESRFLKRNVQAALIRRFATPTYWPRLLSPYYGRSDMAADYYDRHIFDHATFGDLIKSGGRPYLVINATDMANGEQFIFTQRRFNFISSNLGPFPIARAVAASTALPLVLTPITLRNYSGMPGSIMPDVAIEEEAMSGSSHRDIEVRQIMRSYLDGKEHPYIHLIDGGLSDNLSLQSLEDDDVVFGGLSKLMVRSHMERPKKLVLIVVNSEVHHGAKWNKQAAIPGITSVLDQLADDLGSRANYQSLELLRQLLERWRNATLEKPGGKGQSSDYYLITVGFEDLANPADQNFFQNLATSFYLPPQTVDRLTEAGGALLRDSSAYRRLLDDLNKQGQAR